MRYRFAFWSETPEKKYFDICMDVESAKKGWEEIFKDYKVLIPETKLPLPGKLKEKHPEEPVSIPCHGCPVCGERQEGRF